MLDERLGGVFWRYLADGMGPYWGAGVSVVPGGWSRNVWGDSVKESGFVPVDHSTITSAETLSLSRFPGTKR